MSGTDSADKKPGLPPRDYELHEGMKDNQTPCMRCGDPISIHPTRMCKRCLLETMPGRYSGR